MPHGGKIVLESAIKMTEERENIGKVDSAEILLIN